MRRVPRAHVVCPICQKSFYVYPRLLSAGKGRFCSKGCASTSSKTTHGLRYHSLYSKWKSMRRRCYNSRAKSYKNYGGRGIEVYEEWRANPKFFIEWVETNLGPCPEDMSLDRIDNDGSYVPGNLRWATRKQQQSNRRRCSG